MKNNFFMSEYGCGTQMWNIQIEVFGNIRKSWISVTLSIDVYDVLQSYKICFHEYRNTRKVICYKLRLIHSEMSIYLFFN